MKRKCREGNRRERKLTRLILGAILLGAGTLGVPRAEATEYVINDSYPPVPSNMVDADDSYAIYPYPGAGGDIVRIDYNYSWTESNHRRRSFYGGKGSGEVSDRTLIMNQGTIEDDLYGGFSSNGATNYNRVTVNGGTLYLASSMIYGGNANDGQYEASHNTVNINVGVNVQGIRAGWGNANSTGNTLNLGATGIKVGELGIDRTQTIKIGYTDNTDPNHPVQRSVSFANTNTAVLSSTGKINGVGTLDISDMTIPSSAYGTMTLLSGGTTGDAKTSFRDLTVKYRTGTTTTATKTFDSTHTSYDIKGTSVDNDTVNNVTLHYKTDVDTIALASDTGYASNKVIYKRVAKTPVSEVTIGSGMTWGTGRTSITSGCTFNSSTAINASNLTFTGTATVNPIGQPMTLLSGATNITGGSITQPVNGKGTVAAEFTENNIAYTGTGKGTVSVGTGTDAGKVLYTINSGTLSGINLGNWTGTASTIPTNWTGTNIAVNTGNFSVTPTSNIDIFTTDTANFFGTVEGARAYQNTGTFSDDINGVTLSGTKGGGVKATNSGKNLTYFSEQFDVTGISLDTMAWGTPRAATSAYDFAGVTTIDASGLTFTGTANALNASTNLLTGATNLTASPTITPPNNASVAVSYEDTTSGITYNGTSNSGNVSVSGTDVKYTITGGTFSNIDLGGWKGTATALPGSGSWTGTNVSVTAENFAATPTADVTIFTTSTPNFFGTVTGDKAYSSGEAYTATDKGVTLTGTKAGGVKVEDSGATLKYIAEQRDNTGVALGTMTWGVGLAAPASYDFTNTTSVDATNLKFTFTGTAANTIKANDTMDLLSTAKNLPNDLPVTGSPHNQAVSYDVANVAKLSGTLSGAITTTGNTIRYTVSDKTLDSVDISVWNGTASTALDASWTKNASGISVTGSGFTKPTSVLDHTILTASDGFFTNAKIDASIAYQPSGAYSETESNITLSGKQAKGVRAIENGQKLAYSVGAAFIDNLALGAVTYDKGATLLDKSSNFYNYSNLNQIDTTGFSVTMTDDQKKKAQANDSMTLVQGNGTLNDIAAKETDKSNYTYTATAGLDVKGTVTGSVQATGNNVLYTVKDNTASDLTFGSVTWGTGTYARPNTEIAYIDAMVNAENITFTGVDTLAKDAEMVLVSNFGTAVKKTRGSAFTLANGKTGKGHAYWDSASQSLKYVVDRGVDEEVQSKDATGGKDVVPEGQQRKGNVNGGEAEGDGESKGNEAEVKGSVVTNDDGTGGDVNGGTSEDGDADENKATIENSTVEGDVNGGKTDGDGDTEGNETTVSGSKVGGEVNGGHSGRGASRGNETKVDGSEVGGDVNGGKTDGDGDTEKNETTVTNGSKIGGDVNGGHSGGNGGSRGNETKVDGSEVKGDVNGGKTDGNGDTEKNETTVTNGSKIGGDINGGHSGGNGGSKENKTKVDGSEVKGDVNGGKTDGDGDTEKNETTVSGSKVGGDINGGHSGGSGGSKENKTKVDGSEVKGSVNGGKSETGNTEKNETTVTNGSKIGGDVTGGSTGGSGSAKENKATVEGSTVGKDVIGGKSENGPSSTNTATVTNSTVGGNVAGGYSVTGAVTANTATLTDSKITGSVSGGYSENGTVKENTASVTGGSVDGNIYGGKTDGAEPADTNTVDLDGGAVVNGGVFGGYSENGTAEGNTVTVRSASIRDYVYGGKSKVRSSNDLMYFHDGTVLGIIGGGCDEAVNNSVTLMKGGVEEHVIGGFAEQTATGNTVTMTGGTVNGSVIGGYGKATTANDNNVLLGGGIVKGATIESKILNVTIPGGVYGGYGSGTTRNNTVTLYGTADVSATNLVGGSQEATGNTLNLGYIADGTPSAWTGGSQNVQNISNFENVNFEVVPWSESKAAVTITDGAKSDLSKATVGAKNVIFTGVKSVSVNDTMTLLDQSKAAAKATNVVKDSEFTVGSFVSGTGTVSLDGNDNVIYNVESVKASEQTHNTVMGAEASMTALSVGNDFILDAKQGLGLQANIGSDGVATFAKLGGGKMKQETGSHINVNTWNAILALGHTNKKEKSSTEYGAFFEYGSGNYSTHNDADQRGDGSTRYTGGGLLAKWTGRHGLYVEGSFRAGTVHDDARNLLRDAAGMPYSYETDANYLGFSVGVGKEFEVADGNTVDVYGKYFYNRRNGADFTVGDGDFSLDAVTSSVLRVGARYTVKRGNWDFYAGAAYEHEMDGKANGRVNGVSIEGADVSGGSFRGELGATMQPDEKSPWTLGLSVAGYAGKKQGVMGGVSVSFGF